MPQNEKDPFEEYGDEDDNFLTFDARDQEEGINKGPIILAAVALLLAVFGAILFVYFTGGKAKDAPQLASDNSTYKEMPMDNATNAGANGTVANADNAMAATGDKSVYDATNGTNPPPLEVQPSGNSEAPMVSQNSVSAPAAVSSSSTVKPPRPKAVTEEAKTEKTEAEKHSTTEKHSAVATTKSSAADKESAAAKVAAAKPASTASASDAAVNTANASTLKSSTKTAAKAGNYSAQLGAFQSKEAADEALKNFRAKGLTGPVVVSSADLGSKTWYRIRATGFETRQQAAAFCSKSTNVGVNCIPAHD